MFHRSRERTLPQLFVLKRISSRVVLHGQQPVLLLQPLLLDRPDVGDQHRLRHGQVLALVLLLAEAVPDHVGAAGAVLAVHDGGADGWADRAPGGFKGKGK